MRGYLIAFPDLSHPKACSASSAPRSSLAMASNIAVAFPSADVLWWDNNSIRVRCPFCIKSHRHGIEYNDRYETKRGSRVAHCSSVHGIRSHCYQFSFPFSRTTLHVAYEIDKKRKRFVTVGIPQDPEPEEIASLAGSLTLNLNLTDENEQSVFFDNATEMTTYALSDHSSTDPDGTFSQKTIEYAISDCILDHVREVENYLMTTAEQHIFIQDMNEIGDTTLSYAAAERSPGMMALLLDNGAEINRRNRRGRTPLMEAALWGRTENAQILLRHGADKNLNDHHGHTAFNLASFSDRNSDERERRADELYKKHTGNADKERKAIVRLLQNRPTSSRIPLRTATSIDPDYSQFSFHQSPQTSSIELSASIKSFTISRQSKIIARLDRGLPFPSIDAMSGWGHDEEKLTTVSGADWTEEVFRICRLVKHQLPASPDIDQRYPGKFFASHAEKQLIAYLVRKHAFLDDEISEMAQDQVDNRTITVSLQELYLAQPPVSLRKATISVSRKMCLDCEKFVATVEARLNLRIRCICIDFREQAKVFVRQEFPDLDLSAEWSANFLDLER